MKVFAIESVKMENPPTEPEFTAEGLLIPEEYFNVFHTYLEAVYEALDKLNYQDVVIQCSKDGIGPVGGFLPWLEEAALLVWIMTLKVGRTNTVFYPAAVAADIYKVTRDMYATKLLKHSDIFDNLPVN
jgi:hypothetical protein